MDTDGEHVRVILIGSDVEAIGTIRSVIESTEDLEIVAEVRSLEEALSTIPNAHPYAAVVDLSPQADQGPDLIRALRSSHPDLHVVAVSSTTDSLAAEQALRAGALGYIVTTAGLHLVPEAIRSVMHEKAFVSRRIASKILTRIMQPDADDPYAKLSSREREIMGLTGTHSADEIAERLGLSQRTVEDYYRRMRSKLNVSSTQELIALARGRDVSWPSPRAKKATDDTSS